MTDRTEAVPGHRPFRFGVLAGACPDLAAFRRLVRRTEETGYSSLLVPDHLDQRWGPLVSLALAAGWTSRLTLGTLMLAADLRRPAVLFKELATLDQAAPGRLEIGLGAGWFAPDFARAGVPMDPPAIRIARLEETVHIVRELWDKGAVTYRGRYCSAIDAIGEPRPAPARWVMGGGGRTMLRTAARHADIISLTAQLSAARKEVPLGANAAAERFDQRVAWIREDAGDRLAALELQCLLTAAAVVRDSRDHAERVLAPAFGLPPDEVLDSPVVLAGEVPEICDRLRARRERYGISYWVVPAARAEEFEPVVARLAGT
ncbi:TIGR03621 family F420-dependent LLM class oxidoreductase [Streptomyces sp. ME19-01-6]|uniref:TIGR03621 family F420-dependent LLM class oxidoreductase n=1 Tax=Streptomyces sp. ME19-01-6 TaxID=3028686 RepID=UPI0029A1802F|nr:TIGR03621 family F420-dependent LLM class oxidoreductase [Streptomyces sp. ME19-01-6]MDX3225469.1 TIGR03621 family F420-dependent LLM class oxidoreductase [Streptomyces sp. ME19-01-6]